MNKIHFVGKLLFFFPPQEAKKISLLTGVVFLHWSEK